MLRDFKVLARSETESTVGLNEIAVTRLEIAAVVVDSAVMRDLVHLIVGEPSLDFCSARDEQSRRHIVYQLKRRPDQTESAHVHSKNIEM